MNEFSTLFTNKYQIALLYILSKRSLFLLLCEELQIIRFLMSTIEKQSTTRRFLNDRDTKQRNQHHNTVRLPCFPNQCIKPVINARKFSKVLEFHVDTSLRLINQNMIAGN